MSPHWLGDRGTIHPAPALLFPPLKLASDSLDSHLATNHFPSRSLSPVASSLQHFDEYLTEH
jgi:hypothetical protein